MSYNTLATRALTLAMAFAASLLLLKFMRWVETRQDPRPFGMRIGMTTCAEAMRRAGVMSWNGSPEWSGTVDSPSPQTLTPSATSVSIACRRGKFDALSYRATSTDGPDPVGPQLIDRLLSAKWPRATGSAVEGSCGISTFTAGRTVISLDARPACASYSVSYARRRASDATLTHGK